MPSGSGSLPRARFVANMAANPNATRVLLLRRRRLVCRSSIREDEWFESLNHRYISQYHGVCRDKDNAFEVVEGGLTKWSFVADNKGTPWCLRLRMAMQTVELTLYLLRNAIIHCDWKYVRRELHTGPPVWLGSRSPTVHPALA